MTSSEGGLIAGRYRLVSELGRGAMGVVWKARDERLGRTVAVKELKAGVGLSSTQVQQSHLRARREARIAARLHHPNAVAVYDVAEHDERPYLVMEYVESRSLSEVLAEETALEPAKVAEIGVQLASALTAAHEAGIVHRDVKPGNILLTDEGGAKVTDFGISRAVGDATVTGTGEMLGTPAYVAPEVAQGRAASAASDVFSLGATLYAALEGEPPFGTGPNVMALLLRIVNDEIRPPKRIGPLTDALLWMMRNDPADRPSMDVARQSLRAVAAVLASPDGATTPLPTAVAQSTAVMQPSEKPDAAEGASDPSQSAAGRNAEGDGEAEAVTATPAGTPVTTPAATPAATPLVTPAGEPPARERTSTTPETGAKAGTSTDTGAGRRRRLTPWALLVVVALLTGGVVAAIVASNGSGGSKTPLASTTSPTPAGSHGASAPSTGGKASAPASTSPAAPASSASAAASTSATTAASAASSSPTADVATQLTSAISSYYQLVPGHLQQAWGYLTPAYQQGTAKGWSGYQGFWSQVQSVSATDIVAQPPSTVVATITYHMSDGHTEQDRTQFGLVFSGGVWKIASSSNLSVSNS